MKFIGIIPARYASTRFPAKPLAILGGKPVIQRVYEQVAGILDEAYVATDDERIESAVKAFGGKVVMTSVHHKSGTDRCYEAYTKVGQGYDVVVNIQGDEPFIQRSQLEAVKACFEDSATQIATLVKPFTPEDGFEALENVNSPKVVVNKNMNALYFSRSVIPFQRNAEKEGWLKGHTYYKHIGLYAYRADVLKEITSLPQSSLELAESLEQLRWLENGYTIKVGISEVETIGIDTPQDLARAEAFLKQREGKQMLDRTTPPPIRQLSEFSITRPDRRTMKNGMPLNIIHAGTEDVVRFDLLIGGGQWNQEQPLQAMFANRMLREGAGNLTSSQIAERLDYYGAWLELSSSVNYGFITLYSLNKYFARTLAVISEMIKAPTFPAKELSVVADTNKQQFLVNSTRVEMIARKQLNTALFGPEHPFGRYAVAEDYDRITPEVLRSFYRKYYHSGNCSVYISGKVTSEIIRCIEDNLGSGQWGEVTEKAKTTLVPPVTTKEKRIFIEREDALQSSLKMGCFVMDRHHPDFLKARVMVTLFGGYFGSRLMSNIREDKGYTYGIGAGIVSYPGTGILTVSTEAANEYVNSIITEVYREMDKLCNDLVPQEELEMVKNYMLGDLCRSYEGPFSLSDAWIYIETAGLDERFFIRSLDAIRGITREEIRILAQKYFCKENLIEVIAGKKV